MFWLLLNSPCQGQVFLFPAVPPQWVGKSLGVMWLGTGQPERAKGLFHIIEHHLNNKKKEEVEKEGGAGCVASKVAVCQLAGHQSVCGRQWGIAFASLGGLIFISFLHSLNFISATEFCFCCSPLLILPGMEERWGEWAASQALGWWVGSTHSTF